jgi:hypothetical protein
LIKEPVLYSGLLLCLVLGFSARSQVTPQVRQTPVPKSALFTNLPQKSNINSTWIERVFASPVNASISFPLSAREVFKGVVLEKVRKNEHVETINVRSSNYAGSLLTISKIVRDDRAVSYIGRIISMNHSDALVLKQENGQLYFNKEKQSHVVVE